MCMVCHKCNDSPRKWNAQLYNLSRLHSSPCPSATPRMLPPAKSQHSNRAYNTDTPNRSSKRSLHSNTTHGYIGSRYCIVHHPNPPSTHQELRHLLSTFFALSSLGHQVVNCIFCSQIHPRTCSARQRSDHQAPQLQAEESERLLKQYRTQYRTHKDSHHPGWDHVYRYDCSHRIADMSSPRSRHRSHSSKTPSGCNQRVSDSFLLHLL